MRRILINARFLIGVALCAFSFVVAAMSGDGWGLYVLGFLMAVAGLKWIDRQAYLDGFADGVDSVPLAGAGLASGNDRAFDPGHRWNAELGAWEKRA